MSAPQEAHYNAAVRVLRYLYTTKSYKLVFARKSGFKHQGQELTAFTDSTWNTCPDTSKSRGGHVLLLWGSPILWVSKLQTITALSSCEAEYVQACLAARDVVWVRRILKDLFLHTRRSCTNSLCNGPSKLTRRAGNAKSAIPRSCRISPLHPTNQSRPSTNNSEVARHAQNPSPAHWKAVQRIMRYLVGTPKLGLTYKSSERKELKLRDPPSI